MRWKGNFKLGQMQMTFDVTEDPNGTLGITIESITSTNTTTANIGVTNFQLGIDSDGGIGDNSSQLDADFDESITFSFTEDATIT